jgi:hypothetical protein
VDPETATLPGTTGLNVALSGTAWSVRIDVGMTAGNNFGAVCWIAAKWGFGAGRLSTPNCISDRVIYSKLHTSFINHRFVLYALRPTSKAVLYVSKLFVIHNDGNYFSVFKVSWRNLRPGARLIISSPTDVPPKASCNILVSFESL